MSAAIDINLDQEISPGNFVAQLVQSPACGRRPKSRELFRTELDLAFFTMCAATDLESQRHSFAFFSETNLSACGFGRKITLLDNVMPRALQLIGQLSKQKFAFNFPIVSRPIVHLHKVRMLNAMDLLSRFSRSIGLTLKLYGNQASPHRHLRSRKEPIAHRADCWIARSVETCNDIRATEKSIQANVQLRCVYTKLGVEFDEDKIDRIVSDVRDEAHLNARRATRGKYE